MPDQASEGSRLPAQPPRVETVQSDSMIDKACLRSAAALALALVGAAGGASAVEAAATKPSRIDLETDTIGAPPPGFTAQLTGKGKPVQWVVLSAPRKECSRPVSFPPPRRPVGTFFSRSWSAVENPQNVGFSGHLSEPRGRPPKPILGHFLPLFGPFL
jgi:hypothetical protein